jgi:hypothetical protein
LSSSGRIAFQADKVNTTSGSVSAATATATTIGGSTTNYAALVVAYISGGTVNDTCSGIVIEGVISNVSNGSNMTLSVSGTNIQVTQTTGSTQNVQYVTLRLK